MEECKNEIVFESNESKNEEEKVFLNDHKEYNFVTYIILSNNIPSFQIPNHTCYEMMRISIVI